MRRVSIPRAGGYDELRLETLADPVPGPGEVVVRAEAIGVNYADCIVRMGLYESAKKYVGWPITPGFEVAGRVEAVGPGVTDVEVGAEVMAVTRFGGYATHVAVPRDQLFRRPKGFSAEQAAAFPAVFLTAYYALRELGGVKPGMNVLVHSAAGGVGGAVCQLGRIAGARVVGVVGAPHKVEAATRAGAAVVIDKSKDDLWRMARRHAPDGYDIVLDANGVETLRESYRHLAAPGRLVIYGFATMLPRGGETGRTRARDWGKLALDWARTPRFDPLAMTNENKSVLAFNLSFLFERKASFFEAMETLTGWADEGKLAPPPVETHALEDVAAAHRALESGSTVGKLVLLA